MANVTPAPPVKTKPYKAIAAFVLTFLGLLLQSLEPTAEHHPVTAIEWVVTILGALATAGAVYGVTNPAKEKLT
jgi:hypothetical protein